MVPRVAGRGHSFKGAGLYYLHDKQALTSERVAFTLTLNLLTDNPERSLIIMAITMMDADKIKRLSGVPSTGRKLEKPVYTYSLSWHPSEEPTRDQMMEAARSSLKVLGLEEHQAVLVAHNDEPHQHIHVIVNRVHPENAKAAVLSNDRLALSRWAEAYEKEHGKIWCEQRVENNRRREAGEWVKYKDPRETRDIPSLLTELYHQADTGKAFRAALEDTGLILAHGNRRAFVVVDEHGKVWSLSRQVEDVKEKDIRARLSDIDRASIPTAEEAKERIERRAELDEETTDRRDTKLLRSETIGQATAAGRATTADRIDEYLFEEQTRQEKARQDYIYEQKLLAAGLEKQGLQAREAKLSRLDERLSERREKEYKKVMQGRQSVKLTGKMKTAWQTLQDKLKPSRVKAREAARKRAWKKRQPKLDDRDALIRKTALEKFDSRVDRQRRRLEKEQGRELTRLDKKQVRDMAVFVKKHEKERSRLKHEAERAKEIERQLKEREQERQRDRNRGRDR